MRVLASTFELDGPVQRDGSQWVRERHELEDGSERQYYYLLAAGDHASVIMAGHAEAIESEPLDEEAAGDGE